MNEDILARLTDLIVDIRDSYPRVANDADSESIAIAIMNSFEVSDFR